MDSARVNQLLGDLGDAGSSAAAQRAFEDFFESLDAFGQLTTRMLAARTPDEIQTVSALAAEYARSHPDQAGALELAAEMMMLRSSLESRPQERTLDKSIEDLFGAL